MDQPLKQTGEGSVCSVRDFVLKVYGLGFGFRFTVWSSGSGVSGLRELRVKGVES